MAATVFLLENAFSEATEMGKKSKTVDTRTAEEKRSYTMSRIRGKSTSIEVALQKALWHRGVRYRKNYAKVPGSPDIAIVKHRIAVFCDGEFWHGRDWARKKDSFRSNRDFWVAKIERNMARDLLRNQELAQLGWHVLRFWESEIKSDAGACADAVIGLIRELEAQARARCAADAAVAADAGTGHYAIDVPVPPMVAEGTDEPYRPDAE
jgi:DNA mismatch endonuclease (patch repair protein)